MSDYEVFLEMRRQQSSNAGFEPVWMPDFLYDFQRHLVDWAIRKGRAAIFADCGLGKTPMQLVWARNVVEHTSGRVLILTPLAVAQQTEREAAKFGIDVHLSDGGNLGDITITNYEKLHHFDPNDFCGVICDESSILKSFQGKTRKQITRFMTKMSYRLLCTATAAPNDFVELGTSSEALGELSYSNMLKRFFTQLDDKGQKKEKSQQEEAEALMGINPNYFQKLSYRVAQSIGQWRLKHHAISHFWRWVSSWAMPCRMPSDLGFEDGNFRLPSMTESDHVINVGAPTGMLFNIPAKGLREERSERKRTMKERCEFAAALVDHSRSAVLWCHMNDEADTLERVIPDAKQIAGRTSNDRKIELYDAFAAGDLRVLVIKPKIGAFGLNWQHCNHVVSFVTHSYEQYYQSIRRCWRFGQTKPVHVDVIATDGEVRVMQNMRRKAKQADTMFSQLVKEMDDSEILYRPNDAHTKVEVPQWLSKSK